MLLPLLPSKMSEHGATLQTYNQELVKCLEKMKSKREEVKHVINKQEANRNILEKNLKDIQDKLSTLNRSLDHHKEIFNTYNKLIKETEVGFKKIIESSETLLRVAQHEVSQLDNTNGPTKKIDFMD